MEYAIALILWGVFAWYQLMRPAHTYTRTKPKIEAAEPARFEPEKETDELIARLDRELEGE